MPVGTQYSPSRLQPAAAGTANDAGSKGYIDLNAGGTITLGQTYKHMKGVWPAVDATNGPLTADAGLTNSAPSFTGLTLYPWSSSVFNKQSQNWVAVPAANGPALNQCCANVTTNRGVYGSTGIGFAGISDFSYIADTAKVIVAYWVSNSAMPGVSTPHHEVQIFAELEHEMKGIRTAPALWANGAGGGNQMFYRVVTFKEARRRRFRVMLSGNCWLAGVYVDSDARMKKAPNLPFCIDFGDSWEEPSGNVFSSVGGNGAIAGVTYPGSASLLYSNLGVQWALSTGWAVALCNHGGTGWVGNNGGVASTVDSPGFTGFLGISQWNFSFNLWGSRKPLIRVNGGWNDGDTPVSAPIRANYAAVVQAGLNRVVNSDSLAPILVAGVQDNSITAGAGRDLCNSGISDACAATPQVIGFVNQVDDWPSANLPAKDVGPDNLHPTLAGGDDHGENYAQQSAQYVITRARLNQMLTAA